MVLPITLILLYIAVGYLASIYFLSEIFANSLVLSGYVQERSILNRSSHLHKLKEIADSSDFEKSHPNSYKTVRNVLVELDTLSSTTDSIDILKNIDYYGGYMWIKFPLFIYFVRWHMKQKRMLNTSMYALDQFSVEFVDGYKDKFLQLNAPAYTQLTDFESQRERAFDRYDNAYGTILLKLLHGAFPEIPEGAIYKSIGESAVNKYDDFLKENDVWVLCEDSGRMSQHIKYMQNYLESKEIF
jgi:hypothetical protein